MHRLACPGRPASWLRASAKMVERNQKMPRVPRDTDARREGYLAGRRGQSAGTNPYPRDSARALQWIMGLVEGRGKRLKMVRSR